VLKAQVSQHKEFPIRRWDCSNPEANTFRVTS